MALEGKYTPFEFEKDIYRFWEREGYFKAGNDPSKKSYTIMIPPPNVTGVLHMGHILNNTIQDTLIRFKRMQGFNTLWLPGTDHAGIATQNKVEKMLMASNISREDIGREAFIEKTWEWKKEYGGIITQQLRQLGASCDWSREAFTMDEGFSEAVKTIFIKLYEDGLIYRGEYMVNWCPHDETALADDEVNHVEGEAKLYSVAYDIVGSSEKIVIATTRPETIFGDSAIAVHPEDERYQHLVGKKAIVPISGREIEIIADSYVEKSFGTGALKVTPSHDPNDFELGKKHHLSFINIFTAQGIVNELGGPLVGLSREEAREKMVELLKESGAYQGAKTLRNAVGHCYRCDTVIESRVSTQWFVKMKPLAQEALEVVKSGKITIFPERWEKVYYHWLENIRDWCISRQIWWGHQIPAYYCNQCGAMQVKKEMPTSCDRCQATEFTQESDVLDTWFSSWLWPFGTLGWPEKTPDLARFYPTSTLVTGGDILFFWVARMVMAGLYEMKEIPFSQVLLHGIVRDEEGRKMSKSLGNSPEPLELIEKYGADAIRFSFLYTTSLGSDTFYSEKMIEMGSNFANKIWNAAKLVLMNTQTGSNSFNEKEQLSLGAIDRYILSRLASVSAQVTSDLERFALNDAAKAIYDFIWKDYCDWYLEFSKVALYSEEVSQESKEKIQAVMRYVFLESLKLLHPLMPFLTEKIYQAFNGNEHSIMIESYPVSQEMMIDASACEKVELLQAVIREIRNIRTQYQVPPGKKIPAYLGNAPEFLRHFSLDIEKLATLESVEFTLEKVDKSACAMAVVKEVEIYLPLSGLVDIEKERERLQREIDRLQGEIELVSKKLSNENFVSKAKAEIVEKEQEKLVMYQREQQQLQVTLSAL